MTSRTRSPEEIRERIADILGYCLVDGEIHDPDEYERSLGGARWKCPDCGAAVLVTDYERASGLRWALEDAPVADPSSEGDEEGEDSPRAEAPDDGQTSLLENVKEVQESLSGDEDDLEDGVESITVGDGHRNGEPGDVDGEQEQEPEKEVEEDA